jgi:predicted nucleic acid-binding protein
MQDRLFVDSNIIIYAHTDLDLPKQQVAQQLIATQNSVVSTQVLQETANILFKKFGFPWSDIQIALTEIIANNELHINTDFTIASACRLAERYGLSFYDSLIIAAALETNCVTLCSEDMQHGQIIEHTLTIQNPFLSQS